MRSSFYTLRVRPAIAACAASTVALAAVVIVPFAPLKGDLFSGLFDWMFQVPASNDNGAADMPANGAFGSLSTACATVLSVVNGYRATNWINVRIGASMDNVPSGSFSYDGPADQLPSDETICAALFPNGSPAMPSPMEDPSSAGPSFVVEADILDGSFVDVERVVVPFQASLHLRSGVLTAQAAIVERPVKILETIVSVNSVTSQANLANGLPKMAQVTYVRHWWQEEGRFVDMLGQQVWTPRPSTPGAPNPKDMGEQQRVVELTHLYGDVDAYGQFYRGNDGRFYELIKRPTAYTTPGGWGRSRVTETRWELHRLPDFTVPRTLQTACDQLDPATAEFIDPPRTSNAREYRCVKFPAGSSVRGLDSATYIVSDTDVVKPADPVCDAGKTCLRSGFLVWSCGCQP